MIHIQRAREKESPGKKWRSTLLVDQTTGALPVEGCIREEAMVLLGAAHSRRSGERTEVTGEGAGEVENRIADREDRARRKILLCRGPAGWRPIASYSRGRCVVPSHPTPSTRARAGVAKRAIQRRSPLCLGCYAIGRFLWRHLARGTLRARFFLVLSSSFFFPFGNEKTEKKNRAQGNATRKLF
jgi:hypothetical protein